MEQGHDVEWALLPSWISCGLHISLNCETWTDKFANKWKVWDGFIVRDIQCKQYT